jgi:hypothetical protein
MKRGQSLFIQMVALTAFFVLPSLCSSAPVMVERNVFSPDRKPPTDEPAPAAPQGNRPGVPAKSIQLDGVIIHGDAKKALVRVKGQSNPNPNEKGKGQSPYATVKEGGRIAEYQVVKIESKSITLEKDGQVFVVNLFSDGKMLSPLAPVPVSPVMATPVPEGKQPNIPGQPVRMGVNDPGAAAENAARNNPGAVLPMPQANQPNIGVPVPEENAPEEEAVEEEAPAEAPAQ